MKKIMVALMGLLCATTLIANAQDASKPKKTKLTTEQKALQKEMLAKYDTNKNGKLDKNEKAAISQEDKDKMIKAGLLKASASKKKGASHSTGSSTNAPAL
jgi:hypothetical protein